MPTFRDYQEVPAQKCVEFFEGDKVERGIGIFPTGFGKSLIIGYLAQNLKDPTLVIQSNGVLLNQNFAKFVMYGGVGSKYSNSVGVKEYSDFMFVTPGSIVKKLNILKQMGIRNIIVDECDFNCKTDSPSSMFMKIITALQPVKVLGVTASPTKLLSTRYATILQFITRLSKKNGKFWNTVVHVTQIQQMAKYWAKIRYMSERADRSMLQLNSNQSEYTDESVKEFVKANNVLGRMRDGVNHYLKTGDRKSIILYCPDIASAEAFERDYPQQCRVITSNTPIAEKEKIIKNFKEGKFPILANCRILTVGFDHPDLDCIMLGYPTNSWRLYYQILGRIVRLGSYDCKCGCGENWKRCVTDNEKHGNGLVIDLCGSVEKFGKIENITIEEVPGWGWGIFNKGYAISGYDINMMPRRTIKFLKHNFSPAMKAQRRKKGEYLYFHFGKWSGYKITDTRVPESYFDWCLKMYEKKIYLQTITAFERKAKKAIGRELHQRMLLR
jgi:DNA repair protein RadD